MAIGPWLWSCAFSTCHLGRRQNSPTEARYPGGHVLLLLCIILSRGRAGVRAHPSGKF